MSPQSKVSNVQSTTKNWAPASWRTASFHSKSGSKLPHFKRASSCSADPRWLRVCGFH
jgi:hypothetical protein